MTPEQFCKFLNYKPKFIIKGLEVDDVRLICFRDFRCKSATIEFGCDINKKHNGFYFYFEVIDLTGYEEMEFIPIDSDRRHDVVLSWPNSNDDYKKLAKYVNESLKRMYKKS